MEEDGKDLGDGEGEGEGGENENTEEKNNGECRSIFPDQYLH